MCGPAPGAPAGLDSSRASVSVALGSGWTVCAGERPVSSRGAELREPPSAAGRADRERSRFFTITRSCRSAARRPHDGKWGNRSADSMPTDIVAADTRSIPYFMDEVSTRLGWAWGPTR